MSLLLANRFTILLATLVGFILVVPTIAEQSGSMTVVSTAMTAIILAIALATGQDRSRRSRGFVFTAATVALIGSWVCSSAGGPDHLRIGEAVLFALLLFSACASMLSNLSSRRHVDRETLAAALSAYILFGMAMSRVFTLVYLCDHDAFNLSISDETAGVQPSFLYFSFVVLSTVGFGDITPASALSRSLMIIEAIFGMFYFAVVVSRLVSLYRRDQIEADQSHSNLETP